MEDMKISPVGHVILRRTFSEVDRHSPLFEGSSSVGCCRGAPTIEDPQFREYLVVKLSDLRSGSRTLNPGIWFPVSGQLLAMHANWVMIREDCRWRVHSAQCCASASLEIDSFRTKAGFDR
jgi:hypothetical protein